MKTNKYILYLLSIVLLLPLSSCEDDFLEFYPEDKITSANFPQNEEDIKLLLNGVYALLRENSIYNEGLLVSVCWMERHRMRSIGGIHQLQGLERGN